LPDDFLEEIAPLADSDAESNADSDLAANSLHAAPLRGESANPKPAVYDLAQNSKPAPRLQEIATLAVAEMLRQHKGNVSAAAKALGVSRNTVYRKIKQLPVDVWH
jgi:transcriptional regulator of acetoin/glycerol metabolism